MTSSNRRRAAPPSVDPEDAEHDENHPVRHHTHAYAPDTLPGAFSFEVNLLATIGATEAVEADPTANPPVAAVAAQPAKLQYQISWPLLLQQDHLETIHGVGNGAVGICPSVQTMIGESYPTTLSSVVVDGQRTVVLEMEADVERWITFYVLNGYGAWGWYKLAPLGDGGSD